MFDLGATELLLIVIVAVVVIGPKDMPLAMRHAGRWIAQMRKLSGHFRAGLDAMVREAELEEMEKKWAAKNEQIMKEHPPEQAAAASAEAKAAQPAPAEKANAEEPQMTHLARAKLEQENAAKEEPAQTAPAADSDTAGKS